MPRFYGGLDKIFEVEAETHREAKKILASTLEDHVRETNITPEEIDVIDAAEWGL